MIRDNFNKIYSQRQLKKQPQKKSLPEQFKKPIEMVSRKYLMLFHRTCGKVVPIIMVLRGYMWKL